MPVGPPRAREVSKTDSRKKTSATTRPNNEPPSETMLLEGWMTKRIAPELFSRYKITKIIKIIMSFFFDSHVSNTQGDTFDYLRPVV